LTATHEEAVAAAREIGLPVVMKISSPDILHKSDVGGVRVGVATELEVVGAFTAIIESARRKLPQADISGVLVQEMIRGGRETILGMTRDEQFGPMIMFGLGGIYVEVLKDVSFRIAPLTRRDAEEMVGEIRSIKLLRGVRGQPPADFDALVEGLLRLEMDLNPLAVFPKGRGAVAMDARLALKA
jgi:acetyltransferase